MDTRADFGATENAGVDGIRGTRMHASNSKLLVIIFYSPQMVAEQQRTQ